MEEGGQFHSITVLKLLLLLLWVIQREKKEEEEPPAPTLARHITMNQELQDESSRMGMLGGNIVGNSLLA